MNRLKVCGQERSNNAIILLVYKPQYCTVHSPFSYCLNIYSSTHTELPNATTNL